MEGDSKSTMGKVLRTHIKLLRISLAGMAPTAGDRAIRTGFSGRNGSVKSNEPKGPLKSWRASSPRAAMKARAICSVENLSGRRLLTKLIDKSSN